MDKVEGILIYVTNYRKLCELITIILSLSGNELLPGSCSTLPIVSLYVVERN